MVGTTFAVLVAFTFLLAFQSFDRARTASQDESTSTTALFHTAELLPPTTRDALRGNLVCYARAVIHKEWPTMRKDQQSRAVRRWIRALESDFAAAEVRGVKPEAAFNNWFEQTQQRAKARLDEAAPFVPSIVWLFLIRGRYIRGLLRRPPRAPVLAGGHDLRCDDDGVGQPADGALPRSPL